MNVVQYIKESCEIQNATTPEDFIGMARAYNEVCDLVDQRNGKFETDEIWWLAAYVNNNDGIDFRCQPATFANGNITSVNDRLGLIHQLAQLVELKNEMTAAQFYSRFEEIHPFPDGNGRIGSLLFNLLNDTLNDPIHPPAWDSVKLY